MAASRLQAQCVGACLSSSVGSGRLGLWVYLFLAKICILKGMYPAHANGNCYSLRKPYLSALVLRVGPLDTAPWLRLGGEDQSDSVLWLRNGRGKSKSELCPGSATAMILAHPHLSRCSSFGSPPSIH